MLTFDSHYQANEGHSTVMLYKSCGFVLKGTARGSLLAVSEVHK